MRKKNIIKNNLETILGNYCIVEDYKNNYIWVKRSDDFTRKEKKAILKDYFYLIKHFSEREIKKLYEQTFLEK